MENIQFIISLALYLIIPSTLVTLLVWIIYRRLKGKAWYSPGTGFVAEHLYMQWETKGAKAAVQEMVYERDDKKEPSETGENIEPQFFIKKE
ncbi:MAG: hypothetical protein ABIJ45_11970 [Candidatus Zixiibacteriota bacterium]